MKIKEIGIDFFGIFTDFRLNLEDGINIISGNNEAGKSTLLAFLRWVLFGFSKGRINERYAPVSGAAHNGYLLLELEDKRECLVRRQGKSLKGDLSIVLDGQTHNGEEADKILDFLLGPITENVYRKVFAFGLDELATISTLQDSEVSSFLYSSGLYPGNLSLSEIKSQLEKTTKELYSPSPVAKNPLINRDLIALEKNTRSLKSYYHEPEEYNNTVHEIKLQKEEIEQKRLVISEAENGKQYLNLLSQGLQLWKERLVKQDLINSLALPKELPLESLVSNQSVVESLAKEISNLTEEQELIFEKQKQQTDRLDRLQVNEKIITHRATIESLYRELSQYSDWKNRLQEITFRANSAKEHLSARIRNELGRDITIDYLLNLDLPAKLNEDVRKEQQRQAASLDRLRQKDNDYRNLVLEEENLDVEIAQHEKNLAMLGDLKDFPKLKDAFDTYKQHAPSLELLTQRIEDLKTPIHRPRPQNIWLPIVGTVVLLSLTVCFFVLEKWMFGLISFAFAAYSFKRFFDLRRRSLKELELWQAKELDRTEKLSELTQNYNIVQQQIKDAKTILNLENDVYNDVLQKLREQFLELEEKWMKSQRVSEKIIETKDKKAIIVERLKSLQEDLNIEKDNIETIQREWQSFLNTYNLPLKEPIYMLEWLSAARELQVRLTEHIGLEKEKELLKSNIEDYSNKVIELSKKLESYHEDISVLVVKWNNELTRSLEILQEKNEIMKVMTDLTLSEKTLRGKLQNKTSEFNSYLQKGQVISLEDYRIVVKKATEKLQLQRDIELIDSSLNRLAKYEEDQKRILEELPQLTDAELERRKTENSNDLFKLREEEAEISKKIGRLSEKLEQLEKANESEKLLLERADLKRKLNSAAKKWAEVELCKYLIDKARLVYEREKQPGVLKKASEYFERITKGRYIKVVSPLMEQRFEVISADQEIKKPEELSRGTVEQLFLSLRLGLIADFVSNWQPLPLVIDDILVNFDPERSVSALKLLSDLEEMGQILFFTCQPHLIELCEENNIAYTKTILKDGLVIN